LAVLFLGARNSFSWKVIQKDLSYRGEEVIHQTDQKLVPCYLFGQIKQQRDSFFFKKVALKLGSIKPNCPIEIVLTPLNCEVSTDSSYKILQGKYRMTPILKNICPG
jgi:hypothetical protein